MKNKVVVFSGATSGLGQVGAIALAKLGARIVFIARNEARGGETLAKLRAAEPAQDHRVYYADLLSMAETKRAGAEIAAAEPKIDILVNNAGALFSENKLTAEGLERTFALNHMAYFILTQSLRENLSSDARIVSTSSSAHGFARLDFDDLQCTKKGRGFRTYGNSKLCNILFTRALARQLTGTGITANCFHPGFVATNFGAEAGGFILPRFLKIFMSLVAITPEKGAETLIYLASSPKVTGLSGGYFYKCRSVTPSRAALSDEDASRLWAASAQLAGMDTKDNVVAGEGLEPPTLGL